MIKPGLEIVRTRSGDWLCEDIYTSIRTGISTLHIAGDDYDGFVILTPLNTLTGKVLHITAAYSLSVHKVTEYLPEIERMARVIGAREITLASKRNWAKYFRPKHMIYSKEV